MKKQKIAMKDLAARKTAKGGGDPVPGVDVALEQVPGGIINNPTGQGGVATSAVRKHLDRPTRELGKDRVTNMVVISTDVKQ